MTGHDQPGRDSHRGDAVAPGRTPASGSEARTEPDSALSRLARAVVAIGSPLALITALMFYFGWVRTQVQARELGYDVAVLQLSTTDYLLKSINVLFPIVVVALLLVLIGYAAFSTVVERLAKRTDRDRIADLAYKIAGALVLAALIAGAIGVAIPSTRFAAIPVSLTIAVACVFARDRLRPLVGRRSWGASGQVLTLVLLSLLLFWDTERIAGKLGEQFAADIAAYPNQFPEVVIYSQDELNIGAVGVTQEAIGTSDTGYRFRHTGLRLMERAGDNFVLINEAWYDGRGRVIVLKDTQDVRFEFVDPY